MKMTPEQIKRVRFWCVTHTHHKGYEEEDVCPFVALADALDDLEETRKVLEELSKTALPFASFIRNIPQTGGGAIERVVVVSDVIRLRDAAKLARDVLGGEETK